MRTAADHRPHICLEDQGQRGVLGRPRCRERANAQLWRGSSGNDDAVPARALRHPAREGRMIFIYQSINK